MKLENLIKETPKIIRNSNEIKLPLAEEKIKEIIILFLKKIICSVPKSNLKILFNNLMDLNIDNKFNINDFLDNIYLSITNNSLIPGCYEIEFNTINLISKKEYSIYSNFTNKKEEYYEFVRNVLLHELLHVSSSFWTDNMFFSGFSQGYIDSDKCIGFGINEGYTELLLSIYFEDSKCYLYERELVILICEIVGYEAMINLYFNANLLGLLKELSIYSNIEDSLEFIINVDKLQELLCSSFLSKEKVVKLKEIDDKINCFLINCYINKLKIVNNNKEEIIKKVDIFSQKAMSNLKINLKNNKVKKRILNI